MPSVATPATPLPTVSVAEAMGLPEDWNLSGSLSGTADKSPSAPETDREDVTHDQATGAPELPELPETEDDAAEEPASAKAEKAEKPEKTLEGKKPAESEATKAAKTLAAAKKKKGDKPETKPAAPAPAPAAPAAPAPEAKVKVGGKEYTQAELEAALAPKPPAPAAPAPTPQPEPAKVQTAEEVAAAEAKYRKEGQEWIEKTAPTMETPSVDEATIDKILAGGKEAVAALEAVRRRDMAATILAVRRDLHPRFQKEIERLEAMSTPLVQRQEQAENERMETSFKTEYPYLAEHMDIVNTIAGVLCEKEADAVSKMSEKQFLDRLATETNTYLTRFTKGSHIPAKPADGAPAPEGTAAPAAPTAAAAAAAPKPATRPVVKPPGGNAPGAPGAGGVKKKGSDADIIATLI